MNKLLAVFCMALAVSMPPAYAQSLNVQDIKEPTLEPAFMIEVQVAKPLVVGQDTQHGRRQLISITGGQASGKLSGEVLPYGVDSQIIRPDGFTELVARYALKLDDGHTVYIDNSGIRRINNPQAAQEAAQGKIVDPKHVYFATVAKFETYSPKYKWLEQAVFICYAVRLPDRVLLKFYEVK